MIITNRYNLPEPIARILTDVRPRVKNRFSVGDMISAPYIRLLREQHFDEITEDISDMMWKLLGSSVHYIIEGGSPPESLAEEKMSAQIKYPIVCTLVGIPDLWQNETITDYKVTSVWSFILGEKPEWVKQLNLYKWLYELHGFDTKKLQIHAILRDWSKGKSYSSSDYPPVPFQTISIPVWEKGEPEKLINQWLLDYLSGKPCTDEQRWMRPTTYAVKKPKNKRATIVLPTYEEAETYIREHVSNKKLASELIVEERKGIYARCKDYCNVSPFCPYNPYRQDSPKEDEDEQE
jgi:hypothetical protein